ncbi:MAG: hypothetical protein H0X30_06940 [Anaerolineae bacterium]|nr:hypothetical protein [Anaerolineae bacterium]
MVSPKRNEVVKRADEEAPTNKRLPRFKANELVQLLKLTPQQHFTKPLEPYTEALLIKALEQNGVGRPSAYTQTVATIKQRGYVAILNRKLAATALGKEVHQVLSTKLPGLFETTFTAGMEATPTRLLPVRKSGAIICNAEYR